MEGQETYNKLTELTEGLLYFSETEGEFSVYEVEQGDDINSLMEDIADQKADTFKEEDHDLFFDKIVSSLNVEDSTMLVAKERYTELFTFLRETFPQIKVLVAGETEKHIFITLSRGGGSDIFILYAMAVES